MKTTEQIILQFATDQWGHKSLEKMVNKLTEETGEIAGAVVKIPEGRATSQDLDDELGDALIVLSQFAAVRGTTLESLRERRFAQIQARVTKKEEKDKDHATDGACEENQPRKSK